MWPSPRRARLGLAARFRRHYETGRQVGEQAGNEGGDQQDKDEGEPEHHGIHLEVFSQPAQYARKNLVVAAAVKTLHIINFI